MTNMRKAGGIAAVVAAATYVFAMGLFATTMKPMADESIVFEQYMAFLSAHETLVFAWHSSMYFVNGICLVVLVLALHERLRDGSPRLAKIASAFGFIWVALVFLSGLILNGGTSALLKLYDRAPAQAEALKHALDAITSGIDSSDRLLGSLWVGLVSVAALRTKDFAQAINLFGLAIGAAGLVGTAVPGLAAVSYIFGLGAIVWWLALGYCMLRGQGAAASAKE
ncbi:MAG: DUF4386 family protein [Deltaproteobacteria bacterium]|nr:DUF4386 family protein [Deltaproteobacteria bacterium]